MLACDYRKTIHDTVVVNLFTFVQQKVLKWFIFLFVDIFYPFLVVLKFFPVITSAKEAVNSHCFTLLFSPKTVNAKTDYCVIY